MLYCPQCGNNVKEDEQFCVTCGIKLPADKSWRYPAKKKKFHKIWYVPILSLMVFAVVASLFYLILDYRSAQAKDYFEQAETYITNESFDQAKPLFQQALKLKSNFTEAQTSLQFIELVDEINIAKEQAKNHIQKNNFTEALSLISNAENKLTNYNGSIVSDVVNELITYQNHIKIEQLQHQLADNVSIHQLKNLLWEADAINEPEAENITENIRNQIIDFTYSKASEQLSNKQFNDAQTIVQDGLKYAPVSDKLLSLQTTIEKEKVSFEITQQQRIEQAIDIAEEEREFNQNDAIELLDVFTEQDDQGNLVVKGEVKSVATVPIQSVLIDYSIMLNNSEINTNEVYVYPDTLYPEEIGKFEFTHYDTDHTEDIEITINKMTWYTSY